MKFRIKVSLIMLVHVCVSLSFAQSNPPNARLTFTTIEVPGADVTWVNGINTMGDMVGNYLIGNQPFGAFLLSGGNFTLFRYHQASTSAQGINDSGLMVGWIGVDESLGFRYDGTTFTIIRAPGKTYTVANGINNAGDIVGGYGALNRTVGFEFHNGQFKTLFPSGSFRSTLTGINNLGEVVGYTDAGFPLEHGFSFTNGVYQTIEFPGAMTTLAEGINDSGVVVGWYLNPSNTPSGFVLVNGKYLSVNYPGATYTLALGINNLGQIVGTYSGQKSGFQGFVTSPITAADFR